MYIQLPTKLENNSDTVNEVDCEDIQGLTINAQPEQIGLATFVDEAGTCAEIANTTTNHYSLVDVADVQSVKDYLARPRLILSGDVTAGSGTLSWLSISRADVLRSLISTVNYDRLKGAVGFRATLKFTLVVAATPFHQGLLTLAWQYGIDPDTHGAGFRPFYQGLCWNVPHVVLDMADKTLVSLEVPYVSHLEYFPVGLNDNFVMDYGAVAVVRQTNPRVVAGQNAPEFSLYLSLHDVEIIGAAPYNFTGITLQAGKKTLGAATGVSATVSELKKGGLISKTLSTAAQVAKAVSYVPPLSAIGGSTAWFLRSASKVASAFGFSKPNDENKPERMNRMTYAGDSHVDVPFQGWVTSPFQTNQLAVNSALGCTDDDQMAFDYILTKPSLIYRGNFSDTDTSGTLLWGSYVSINSFWYRDKELAGAALNGNVAIPNNSTGTKNCIVPSTLLYVGNNFRYWRGNLRFKVHFSKSKMHGGRVQFTYVPYTSVPAANLQLGTGIAIPEIASTNVQPIGMSTIFDLRDGSSFEFVAPYLCTDPYLPIEGACGSVSMIVVNNLRSPGQAASTVDFVVTVAAEPGFEFAVIAPATLGGLDNLGVASVTYQSGKTPIVEHASDTSQNVIGEIFNSAKQLAMVPSWYTTDVANATYSVYTLAPWFKLDGAPVTSPFGTGATVRALWNCSPAMRVAAMYSFANGSTNYQLSRDGGTTQNFTMTSISYPNASGAVFTQPSGIWNRGQNTAGGFIIPETSEAARVSVPLFSRFLRIPTVSSMSIFGGHQEVPGQLNYNPSYISQRTDLTVRNGSGATRRLIIGRSAGEDARAAQFIGPPACALYPAASTVSPVSTGDVWYSVGGF